MECAERDCNNENIFSRSLCQYHYKRWLEANNPRKCNVDDCSRGVVSRGLCQRHYSYARKHDLVDEWGDPPRRRGFEIGHEVTYSSIHQRVNHARGPARAYFCIHCDDDHQAQSWALSHDTPSDRLREGPDQNGTILAYSTDIGDYLPLCWKAHSKYDGRRRDPVNGRYLGNEDAA